MYVTDKADPGLKQTNKKKKLLTCPVILVRTESWHSENVNFCLLYDLPICQQQVNLSGDY